MPAHNITQVVAAAALVFCASQALAAPTQIFRALGTTPGMVTPNLVAERNSFLSLFNNTVQSFDFEGLAQGDGSPLTASFTGSASSINATLNGSTGQQVMESDEAGRFNTTSGGRAYWRVDSSGAGVFDIDFDVAVSAFGFYGTDIGDFGGLLKLVLTRADIVGTEELTVRDLVETDSEGLSSGQVQVADANGAARFFAFANSTRTYSRISFVSSGTLTTQDRDYFGFDDFIVADSGQFLQPTPNPPAAPEPGSLALAGLALLAAGWARRRGRQA